MKRKGLSFPLIMSALLGGMVLASCGPKDDTQETQGTLQRIEVSNPVTTYNVGDSLIKPTVTAYYDNGTTKNVTSSCNFIPDGLFLEKGQKTVTVNYLGKTTTYTVNVVGNEVTSLKVGDNTKTTFAYGEAFQKPTSILAVRENGTTTDITLSATVDSSKYNPHLSGTYEIKVTYYGITIKYDVIVNAPTNIVQEIEIQGEPKNDYSVGDTLVKPTVIATFMEGTQDVTDECEFIYDFSTVGEKAVTVKYKQDRVEKTTLFYVNVTQVSSKLKFAVIADVQLCAAQAGEGKATNLGETANAPLALEQHLKYIKDQGINVLVMDGDITNQANEHYYQYFETIVTKVYGSDKTLWPEFVWTMGNHEWWEGTTEKDPREANVLPEGKVNAVKLFNDYARIESDYLIDRSAVKYASNVNDTIPSYYKVINGVPFLAISAVNASGLINDALKTEINSWLADIESLDSVKAGGPIFVEYHYPLATSMTHGQGSIPANTTTINEIFGDIPNAIIFTGDTHFPGINERSINQDKYTTINIGTSSYSRMVDESAVICSDYENVTSGNKTTQGDHAQGNAGYLNSYTPTIQIVEVFDNNTTKIERKMTNPDGTARKVAEDWLIPATKSTSDFVYTNARFQNTASAQKLYGKDGLSWENTDTVTFGVNEEAHQMTVHFKDPVEHHFVEHYDIKVNGVSHDFVSTYYIYPETRQDNYYVIENLPHADSYTVEVTAYDFYDNPSLNKLTSSTNDETKCIEPIDMYFADGNFNYSDIETRNNFIDTAEGSNSSTEFYYRGIQTHNAGAILGRLINGNLKVSNYLSLESGEGSKPVVKFDVKNLKDEDLVFGLSVVTNKSGGGEDWKTDFGVEYQKTVTGKNWTTLSWDLNALFGITSKEALKNITLKAKSKAATSEGYEMNFLVDNIDIVNGGDTPTPPTPSTDRGELITAGEDTTISLGREVQLTEQVSVDLKLDETNKTGKVAIALLNNTNWDDYYGYYSFFSNGKMENTTTGVTISSLSDGYFRVTFNLPELVKIHGANLPASFIDTVYVRGEWTDINGRIDVNPSDDIEVVRGVRFEKDAGITCDLSASPLPIDQPISIDIKFDETSNNKRVALMLGEGWNNFYGYFDIYLNGTVAGNPSGVEVKQLSDGYTRIIFTPSEITKINGAGPSSYIDVIYIRDIWCDAGGYIDINAKTGTVIRGQKFIAGSDFIVDFTTNIELTDTFVFDVKFEQPTEENYISFMLGQGWSQYYGYFKIKGNGTLEYTYNGVTISTLSDGYYRVTMTLSQLTKVNDMPAPDSYINLFYISQSRSSGSGYIELNPAK